MPLRSALLPSILGLVLLISGCGFQPLNQRPTNVENDLLQQVWVATIEDRIGQQLRNRLLSKLTPLGAPRNPRYVLEIEITESTSGLGIAKDDFATRSNLEVTANFKLIAQGNNPEGFSGSSSSTVSYNVLDSITGTRYSEDDARNRAIEQVAQDIRRRLAIYLKTRSTS